MDCMSERSQGGRFRVAAKYASMAFAAARRRGVVSGVADLAAEWSFDRRHGLAALMPREVCVPNSDPGFRVEDAIQYQGVDPRLALEVLESVPRDFRAGATFVDYGCGKGRGLAVGILAGFRRLIGVEVSAELANASERNLGTLRERHPGIELVIRTVDAARFEPPEGPVVAFLYNPFVGPTLRQVADRLGRLSVRSPVWVAYVNPRCRLVFAPELFAERAVWQPSRAVLLESRTRE